MAALQITALVSVDGKESDETFQLYVESDDMSLIEYREAVRLGRVIFETNQARKVA